MSDDVNIENTLVIQPVSVPCASVAKAFAAAQAEIGHATKGSKNPHFKSMYADLATVIETVRPALEKHKLATVQLNFPCKNGILLQTVLMHESGEWIADGGLHVPASKLDAQGYGSAMTYARRYGLASLLGVAQADDDGNAAAPKQQAPGEYVFRTGKHEGKTPKQVLGTDPSYIDWAVTKHGDKEAIQAALA